MQDATEPSTPNDKRGQPGLAVTSASLASQDSDQLYPGEVLAFAQPHRVGALGALHGLAVAPPDQATVLDLGCGIGTNLIAIAAQFPGSRCLGIDRSAASIAHAAAQCDALALSNITFICADFETLRASLDRVPTSQPKPAPDVHAAELAEALTGFSSVDYVIAHRVASLLSASQRHALYATIGALLAPHGVAMISFDTLPGDHDWAPLRALMRHHVENVQDDAKRVKQAREIAALHIARWDRLLGEDRTHIVTGLYHELAAMPDSVILQDFLGAQHQAFSLVEFAQDVASVGLTWLTNARMSEPRTSMLPDKLRELVRATEDPVARQQYLDFFRMTRFRTSLLCRTDAVLEGVITRAVEPAAFVPFWVASRIRPEQIVANTIGGFAQLEGGAEASLSDQASRTLGELARNHPAAVPVASLLVGEPDADNIKLRLIAELWLADVIDLTLG